jgi:peroxiredoxin
LADYRERYAEIRAAGADVAAVSVDPPEKSAVVRRQLQLPFEILCDTDRRVIQDWDIYNPKEKGGIAKPATFILDPGRVVRFASVDEVAKRVPASEITDYLRNARMAAPSRKSQFPHLGDFIRAIRNGLRLGAKSSGPNRKSQS